MSVRSTLVQADSIPEWLILGANAFLAIWVLLAAGGAWLLRSRGGESGGLSAPAEAIVAGLMLTGSIAAISVARLRSGVLMVQAVVVFFFFAVGLVWSASVVLSGDLRGTSLGRMASLLAASSSRRIP